MKDVLIIAHFTQVPGEEGNGRFHYIAEKLDKQKSSVEVVTTDFSHRTKKRREVTDEQKKDISYKLTLLKEPNYLKNVSLKRFYSHYMMGRALKKYLLKRKKPDVIYCAIPSLDVAKVAAKFAKKNKIYFVIDIQDLWPEAFKMIFNVPIVKDLIFYPMKRKADYVYTNADKIIAVSQTYVDRALLINKRYKESHSVYLGTDLKFVDNLILKNKLEIKPNNEIWVVYIGTLGHSYDLTSVIDALLILKNRGIDNIKLIVMGDGPLKRKFEDYANEQEIYSKFTGRLDYSKMLGILKECDIAINPIKAGSAGSIINKVGDYAATGLPVINTQESLEYRNIVQKYMIGLNCLNNNSNDLAEKLYKIYSDKELRTEMGKNNRKIAEKYFDRGYTYQVIFDSIITNNKDKL